MLSWDLETERFGPCNLAPEPICLSVATEDGTELIVAACEPEFDEVLAWCLDEKQSNTRIAFDMAVILAHRPHLADKVWKAYEENRVTCTIVREKLLVLADTGDLEYLELSNGAKKKLEWSQVAMEEKYLGISRRADKTDDDAWRSNYAVLKGVPAKDYPAEAREYNLADSRNALAITKAQGILGIEAEFLNARADLALYLSSCWGFPIDQEFVQRLHADLTPKFHSSHFPHLIAAGMLVPEVAARPYKTNPAKSVAAKPAKYSQKGIRARVEEVCKRLGIEPKLTDTGEVSYSAEALQDLAGHDPAIDELIARGEHQKLVTTELPRMMNATRVHPKYDIIKKTGRTSSYGNSKKDANPAYPAVNIQQIDPRVRDAYVASPGNVLCSVDYNFIELVAIAQKCLTLFDESVLADLINAGKDPHANLGAQIAGMFDGFKGTYDDFVAKKKTDRPWYDHWRTLAKPTGLGFSGGLGAVRFLGYAKSTFGVDIIKIAGSYDAAVEMAKNLKQVWLQTYPEMQDYFNWVKRDCQDLDWSTAEEPRYQYSSPFGMIRRNCMYTEATNGAGLQTATAEGAKIALWNLARACHDASINSILLGSHPVAFIHDEVIVEMPHDEFMHERAFEVARIMREGMEKVMTRVKVGAAPACMFRWNKKAEAVFHPETKKLQVWAPSASASPSPSIPSP